MKVSVSLPGVDVEFLDAFAREQGLESRSAALRHAVHLLRLSELRASYASAWEEMPGDDDAWDVTAGDGIVDEGRG
jgi:Arc/MetJ-type ribon-helix-helix transcriptional regulator